MDIGGIRSVGVGVEGQENQPSPVCFSDLFFADGFFVCQVESIYGTIFSFNINIFYIVFIKIV